MEFKTKSIINDTKSLYYKKKFKHRKIYNCKVVCTYKIDLLKKN